MTDFIIIIIIIIINACVITHHRSIIMWWHLTHDTWFITGKTLLHQNELKLQLKMTHVQKKI